MDMQSCKRREGSEREKEEGGGVERRKVIWRKRRGKNGLLSRNKIFYRFEISL